MRRFHGGPPDRRGYHHGNLKEAMVEAARRFIAERGLGGFTLVDAARLVGVTPAALYRHFSGRDALVGEVAERGFAQLAQRLRRAMQGAGTPLERFTRMGEAYLAFAEEELGFYAAMFAPRSAEDGAPAWPAAAPPGAPGTGSRQQPAGPWGPPPEADAPAAPHAFGLLLEALTTAFPDGFGVDPRFVALEVWALSHGIATLDAAGQLPKGPAVPDKYELLRAGVGAIVLGASLSRPK